MNTDKREAAIEQLKTDLRNILPQMLDDTDFSMVVGACEAFAQEIYAARDERIAELEKALGDCVAAIETLAPHEFGIGGGKGVTHWYIRDELLARSKATLAKEDEND